MFPLVITISLYFWFLSDVTKIISPKPQGLLRFYFHLISFSRNLLMRSRRQLTATNVVLNLNITDQRFCFTPENNSQVFSQLNKIKLNKSKATGLDKISATLIRECADLICISICKLFNCSLTTGIFPDYWKCAKVTSLFKQGSSSGMNNYRPISFIFVVFERVTYDQVYAYLSENNIISKSQS